MIEYKGVNKSPYIDIERDAVVFYYEVYMAMKSSRLLRAMRKLYDDIWVKQKEILGMKSRYVKLIQQPQSTIMLEDYHRRLGMYDGMYESLEVVRAEVVYIMNQERMRLQKKGSK